MPISGKEVVKRLRKCGWKEKSQKGSHVKLEHPSKGIVVVPIHGNKDLGIGLIRAIEKQTLKELL